MKLAEVLQEVFGGLSSEIAKRRAEILAPDLRPGETMPDAELEHELYLRLLDRRLDEATEAERAYRLAAIRFKSMSRRRDRTTAELNGELGALRQIVDLARGKGTSAALLALKGRTERRQEGVLSQASDVLARLDGLEGRSSSAPTRAGVSADPAEWKKMIEPGYRQLAALQQQIIRQEKNLVGLLFAKEKAFAAFDDTGRSLIRIAEGQCRLVGRLDLAKRLRRFSRKRQRPGPKPKKKAARKRAKAQEKKTAKKQAKAEEKAKKERDLASARVA